MQGLVNALVVLNYTEKDKILIVADSLNRELANHFHRVLQEKKYEYQSYDLGNSRPYKLIRDDLKSLVEDYNSQIIINLFNSRIDELTFRVDLLRLEQLNKARIGHVLDTDLGIFNKYMAKHFEEMRKKILNFFAYLNRKRIDQIKVTTKKGTNLDFKVLDRKWYTDVKVDPGNAGNFPCGEVFIAPIENSVNGSVIADVSVGDFQKQNKPSLLFVKEGIVDIAQIESPLLKELENVFAENGDANLAGEFGIGFNKNIRIEEVQSTVLLEKAYGTAHLAFGSNEDFGGKNFSNIHIDFVFDKPDIFIDGLKIIEDGKLIIEEISESLTEDL